MTVFTVGTVTLSVAALSDRGLKREANEDSYFAEGPAFVVADGMGGYEAGDLASAAVVNAFRDRFAGVTVGEFAGVSDALLDADDRVAAVAGSTTRGAGSTATGVVLVEHEGYPFWLVFNVGDSRVYKQSGAALEQLTTDHSLGRELVLRGELREDELATFPNRNVITRAIGAADSLADSWLVPVVDGDRLMLCSDGLHGELDDETIRAILTMNGQPEAAAQVLIERANAHGGRDNITVVVIDVVSGGGAVAGDDGTSGRFAPIEDTVPVR
jgi:serine/threonine protein phosphatase PrpC